MSYKKSFIINLLVAPLIISCTERKSIDLYDESSFWITDNSQIIINNYYSRLSGNILDKSPYIMYNCNNSGYTVYCDIYPTPPLIKKVFLYFYITTLNGQSNDFGISTCKYDVPKRVNKTLDYIPITNRVFHHYKDQSEEEKEKIESLFGQDTKITKHELKDVYLTNRCSYYLYNNDIHLCASETQFSFSTGLIKDENGEDKNIILKATSNTTFKIYDFVNKERVGDILLEGTMSNITIEDDKYFISFTSTKDYYFNGKYDSFKLEIDQLSSADSYERDSNFDFIFPEDID